MLDLIDAHMHVETRTLEDLESMAMAGIKAVISPTVVPQIPSANSQTLFFWLDRLLTVERERAKQNFINVYVAAGIVPFNIVENYEVFLAGLKKYIENGKIVALGELGIDPTSKACPDVGKQQEVLRSQLEIAKKYDLPVFLHTPLKDKQKYVEMELKTIEKAGLDAERVVIDHANDEIAKQVLDFGANLAISVQPWRMITPSVAADIIEKVGVKKVMVDSDSSGCI